MGQPLTREVGTLKNGLLRPRLSAIITPPRLPASHPDCRAVLIQIVALYAVASHLRAELLAFPTGRHDDQVDALGLCGPLMDRFAPGYVPRQPDPATAWDRSYLSADEIDEFTPNRRNTFLTL